MHQQVLIGKKSMIVRGLALRLVRHNPQKDWSGEIRDLHAFVRDNIRYVRDIRHVETIQSAEKTLEFGQGDCDDKSILLASLLESISHPTRFVAISLSDDPENYVHVFPETKIGERWVSLETTEPVAVGWLAPDIAKKMIYFN